MPVYLTDFHTENDIAVFSLAISLNIYSIRLLPVPCHLLIQLQQLNKQNDNEKLFNIIFVFLSLNFD